MARLEVVIRSTHGRDRTTAMNTVRGVLGRRLATAPRIACMRTPETLRTDPRNFMLAVSHPGLDRDARDELVGALGRVGLQVAGDRFLEANGAEEPADGNVAALVDAAVAAAERTGLTRADALALVERRVSELLGASNALEPGASS